MPDGMSFAGQRAGRRLSGEGAERRAGQRADRGSDRGDSRSVTVKASKRVVLGIEVEDDRLAAQLAECHRLAAVGFQREVRGRSAFFDHLRRLHVVVRPSVPTRHLHSPRGGAPSVARGCGDRRLRVRGLRRRASLLAWARRRDARDAPALARPDAARRAGGGRAAACSPTTAAPATSCTTRTARWRSESRSCRGSTRPERGPRRLLWFAGTTAVAGALAIRAYMTGVA